ncbi:AI-2E family transporter [Pedococcus sp. 5OH_020]|uniref:AI-2E family transporter n=1 Tax=Pedococcus sp. 5OH_020 TaxID=2989814 RepID=UPI0022E9D82B|nr:AI-2E family transporter [Pedococcus sp. 5OH_020]
MSLLDRWKQYRRTQREYLRASNHPVHTEGDGPSEGPVGVLFPEDGWGAPDGATPREEAEAGRLQRELADEETAKPDDIEAVMERANARAKEGPNPYGRAGRPINRQSPFYMGFTGAIGVLTAVLLWQTIGRLTTVMTLVVVAFFLTLALNPIVEALTNHGVRRPFGVALVFAGVVTVFTLLGLLVVPPVIAQGTDLAQKAPEYLDGILKSRLVTDLDRHYNVVDRIQAEVTKRMSDGTFVGQVFGGVLGVGAAVIGGVFQGFTVLVLTLFLLASLPRVKQAAYAIVPVSRRARVISLSEEIMRRTGSYAIGQVAIATINAFCSWIMMLVVGIPYAAVLAVAVGFLGLIPMVGASVGASVVCLVAVFDEPRKAVIAAVYYVVYQQLENYVVAPRIMQRTVSVPGAVTVVAALAGGTLLGVIGALLAIPVAAGLLLLYEEVLLPRQRRH